MARYLYDDEDNAPMNEDAFDGIHNPTVYNSRAEMKYFESNLPFDEPPLPEKGCWNCMHYNGDACTAGWNNMDESYYNPDLDDRNPDDVCDDWEFDSDVIMDDYI